MYARRVQKSSVVSTLSRDITLGSTTTELRIGQYSQRLGSGFRERPRGSSSCVFFESRHATTRAVGCVSSTLCHWNLCAIRCAPRIAGFNTEVSHATQERAPRRRLLSRSPVNEGRASLPRLGSNAEGASLAATKSSERSSVGTIHARASLAGDFKNCCMLSGEFDGSDRDHFFQRVTASNSRRKEPQCVVSFGGRGTG